MVKVGFTLDESYFTYHVHHWHLWIKLYVVQKHSIISEGLDLQDQKVGFVRFTHRQIAHSWFLHPQWNQRMHKKEQTHLTWGTQWFWAVSYLWSTWRLSRVYTWKNGWPGALSNIWMSTFLVISGEIRQINSAHLLYPIISFCASVLWVSLNPCYYQQSKTITIAVLLLILTIFTDNIHCAACSAFHIHYLI